jgi:hypothetical protein
VSVQRDYRLSVQVSCRLSVLVSNEGYAAWQTRASMPSMRRNRKSAERLGESLHATFLLTFFDELRRRIP